MFNTKSFAFKQSRQNGKQLFNLPTTDTPASPTPTERAYSPTRKRDPTDITVGRPAKCKSLGTTPGPGHRRRRRRRCRLVALISHMTCCSTPIADDTVSVDDTRPERLPPALSSFVTPDRRCYCSRSSRLSWIRSRLRSVLSR